jgi:tripartite-type tricarboxylate transporter receptor subunit TctC
VNNPIEQVSFWEAGKTRALCIFDTQRSIYKEKTANGIAWADIPTCRESGLDMDYLMLRGIFMPGNVKPEVVDYYVNLMKKVRETPEWKDFMVKGAYNQTFMSGDEFKQWVAKADETHEKLMEAAGFIKKK